MALKEWNTLFTDSAALIWQNERIELKRAAMLLHVLGLEFAKIKIQAESQLDQYRAKYIQIDNCIAVNTIKKSPPEKFNFKTPTLTKLKTSAAETITGITPLNISTNSNVSKQSYVSPDLFRFSSPESTSKLDENINEQIISSDEDIILSQSPKIKKNPKLMKMRRSKDTSILHCKKALIRDNCLELITSPLHSKPSTNSKLMFNKLKLVNKDSTPPANAKCVDETIIEATPEPVNRNKSKLLQSCMTGNKSKIQKTKLFNNTTLTQMFPPVIKMDDSDTTVREIPEHSMKVEDILGMLEKEKEKENIVNNDDDFQDYVDNYDKVPEKKQAVPVEKLCKLCDKLGKKCARHRTAPLTQEHRTYTGFWDLDFSVEELNNESEDSTIF